MTEKHFILNKNAHYFVVIGNIKKQDLENCDFFNSLPKLLLAAAEISEVALEEVEGNFYSFVQISNKNDWHIVEPRGVRLPVITESIERYLSDWTL
ncbi:hypothetical protein [Psychromonas sp. SP041]|uniref:hypothetical protein n=1 Tax=Psychromonas sp. SP041 TaxID=1365007 RepID=UPI0010C7D124|nr:hypothetical protein [Psychromonas sp. SP041]